MPKRFMIHRRSSVSTTASDCTQASRPPLKRANSKQEVFDEADECEPVPTVTIATAQDLEANLKKQENQKRGLRALSKVHCTETLACLIELFRWEMEKDEKAKKQLESKIRTEFLQEDMPNEICLPDGIKQRIENNEADLLEVKTYVLNDLRFNPVLLKAIGAKSA